MRRVLLPVFLLVFGLSACGDPAPAPAPGAASSAPAVPADHEVIWTNTVNLGACAIGDVDPDRPGLEVVAVDGNGDVHLVYRDGDGWGHETIAQTGGEKIQCAVGRFGSGFVGEAIAVVGVQEGREDEGGKGAVGLVGKTPDGWVYRPVAGEFQHLVHGVLIADVDPSAEGNELLVGGFDKRLVIYASEDGVQRQILSQRIAAPAKAIAAWTNGVAVVEAGKVMEVFTRTEHVSEALSMTAWTGTLVSSPGMGFQARIAQTGDGARLLVACDDGTLRLFDRDEGGDYAQMAVLTQEAQKLRGAVFGNFKKALPGEPVRLLPATAGYEGKVTLFEPTSDGTWHPVFLYDDGDKLHFLAVGDLLPEAPGDELVTCGTSGRLVLIRPATLFAR